MSLPNRTTTDALLVDEHVAVDHILIFILNSLSLFSSLFLIVFYVFLRNRFASLLNRDSLRLAVAIGCVNVFYSIIQIVRAFLDSDSTACSISTLLYAFTTLLFVLLTASIAFTLQCAFSPNSRVWKERMERHEWLLYTIPCCVALALAVPGYVAGVYGFSRSRDMCWYKDVTNAASIVWMWGTLFGWVLLSILYCTAVVVVVLRRLYASRSDLERTIQQAGAIGVESGGSSGSLPRDNRRISIYSSHAVTGEPKQVQLGTSNIVARTIRYPLIPLVTQTFVIVREMDMFVRHANGATFWIVCTADVLTGLQGVLVLLAFMMDPAIDRAWKEYKRGWIAWYWKTHELKMAKQPVGIVVKYVGQPCIGLIWVGKKERLKREYLLSRRQKMATGRVVVTMGGRVTRQGREEAETASSVSMPSITEEHD